MHLRRRVRRRQQHRPPCKPPPWPNTTTPTSSASPSPARSSPSSRPSSTATGPHSKRVPTRHSSSNGPPRSKRKATTEAELMVETAEAVGDVTADGLDAGGVAVPATEGEVVDADHPGVRAVGSGMRSRARRAVWWDMPMVRAASSRAPARRRTRTRRSACRPSTGRSATVRRWHPCTRPDCTPHIGQTAVSCGVRASTTIRPPSSTTSSMTSGERPEHIVCASLLASITRVSTSRTTLRHHRHLRRRHHHTRSTAVDSPSSTPETTTPTEPLGNMNGFGGGERVRGGTRIFTVRIYVHFECACADTTALLAGAAERIWRSSGGSEGRFRIASSLRQSESTARPENTSGARS